MTQIDSVVLDSSCWISWLTDDPRAAELDAYLSTLSSSVHTIVPATVVYEVYRWILRNVDDARLANNMLATLAEQDVVPTDAALAQSAAQISVVTGLAHADAMILAAARQRQAVLVTLDADFAGLPGACVLGVDASPA